MASPSLGDGQWLVHFRAGRDPVYFAEVFMGVRLNPAQRRFFLAACRTVHGWEWAFRRAVHVSGNQTGKSVALALAILWASTYKIGLKNDDWDYWLNAPYNWFHLAPTYTQTLIVQKDIMALADGIHTAQYDKLTGERRPVYWSTGMHVEKKFDATYPGITLFNGSNIHFRTSDDKAKSLQGVRANGISFDEAAFEGHLAEIMDTAIKLRLVSTGGPCWLVSTPNGINDFFVIVDQVLVTAVKTGDRVWEAAEQQLCLVWSHISDNIGYGLTQEDVDFMERDVDPATREQQLRGAFLEPKEAFFVPADQILRAFTRKLPVEQTPMNDHSYVVFWDPSASNDPTVVIVLDVTRKPWKGVYFRRTKPMPFRELLSEMLRVHAYYSTSTETRFGAPPRALTGFDSSSMGGVFIRQELAYLTPQRPVNMTGSARVKTEMLMTLKAAMSKRDLYLPAGWVEVKREVANYKLDDSRITQDCVIALAGATKLASEGYGGGGSVRAKFDPGHSLKVGAQWT